MEIPDYEKKKQKKLKDVLLIYILFSSTLAVGVSILLNNWIPFVVTMLFSGYLYNLATN